MRLNITFTEIAQALGVDKSDISHALSPRAQRKRYVKLRQRIRKLLHKLRHNRPRYNSDVLEKLGYRIRRDEVQMRIIPLIDECIERGYPIPPISLSQCAKSFSWNATTFYRALHGDPRIAKWRRDKAKHMLDIYLRELYWGFVLDENYYW